MDLEIGAVSAEDFEPFTQATHVAFGGEASRGDLEEHRLVFEPDRSLAVRGDGTIVGTAAAVSLRMTVPGAVVPTAGVTLVGVVPTHRRRGILTELMRRQLADVRERGEPLAALWASEGAIYGRFGYGLASFACDLTMDRRDVRFIVPEGEGRVRLLARAEAFRAFDEVYDRVRPEVPGCVDRTPDRWEAAYQDPEQEREGFGPILFALHEGSDGPDGYAIHRLKHDWPEALPRGRLEVLEVLGATPRAYAGIWRYVVGIDLVGTIVARIRPIDDPLVHMVAEPRALHMRARDGLWIRLVEVASALEARRYPAEGRVVLEVRDAFCPWNDGRFALEGGPDGASCRPTKEDPDLALDAADLGAVYLGGTRLETLAASGRIGEAKAGSVRRAGAMFAWHRAPWCPWTF